MNQQGAVMDAVQVMRARAKTAGNLESNKQVKVVTEGPTIVVEPADPEVVYVPAYDPWIVYGAPVVVWPGWYPYPGLYVAGPGVSVGVGFAVGLFAGFAWGSHGWGCDWGHRTVVFNHNTFISNSNPGALLGTRLCASPGCSTREIREGRTRALMELATSPHMEPSENQLFVQ